MSELQWSGSNLANHAQGRDSEFVIFASLGKFDLVQRRRVGSDARKKFAVIRQQAGLSRPDALRIAQEWEDA